MGFVVAGGVILLNVIIITRAIQIAKGIKDKIANVRFYTVKLVNEYIKQFDSSSKEKIKTLIRDLTKDEDNDVKFYASKLLESMK